MPSITQPQFERNFRHGVDVRDDSALATALERAGISVEQADALDGQVDGIIARDGNDDFYHLVADLNGRRNLQRAGAEYALYKAAKSSKFNTAAEATRARDLHVQAMLTGPGAGRLGPVGSARLDEITSLPRGSEEAKASAVLHIDDYHRASDYEGMVNYLNVLQSKDPAAFQAAVGYLVANHTAEPRPTGYRNNWGNDVYTERLFEWVDARGSSALKAQFAAEVFKKVDPNKSAKYDPYMTHVFKWLEQPAIAGRLVEGQPRVMQDILMATPHWEASHPGQLNRIVSGAASYYGHQIGEAINAGDYAAVRRHSVNVGQLLGGSERSIRSFYGRGADKAMEEVMGWFLKGLSAAAMTPLSAGQRAAYALASPLVGKYLGSPDPIGPKKADAARNQAMALLDELYWNTVDPKMELRTIEGGEVVPLTSMKQYQRLRSELSVIHADIADGFQHAKNNSGEWL